MSRKILLLGLLAALCTGRLLAQNPCSNPPDCLINGNLVPNNATSGDIDNNGGSGAPTAIPGWYGSTGTPSIWTGNPGTGIWMWSYNSNGERVFTCFNFLQNHTYTVCFKVKNTSAQGGGSLMVVAANGLGINNPTPSASQTISGAVYHNTSWNQVCYTFTASAAFSQLSIYPFWTGISGPANNYLQYELVIDDVQVTEQPTLSASASVVTRCSSAMLSIGNISPSATVSWSPAAGLSSTTGSKVVARPCSTTTYTATINSNCPSVPPVFLPVTVTVSGNDTIINSTANVNCSDSIHLAYSGTGCIPVSYNWVDPAGNNAGTGPVLTIPHATAANSGTYQLDVQYPNGCTRTLFTGVNVTGCCSVQGDFTINGCNPVRFEDITSGGGGQAVGWMWELGDGSVSTLRNPAHLYMMMGKTTVCLTTIFSNGNETCCDRVCKDFDVCDWTTCVGKAAFGVSNINSATHAAQFTDYSAGSIAGCTYAWDFGDGSPVDYSLNPAHQFPGPGIYHVCYTAGFCGAQGTCFDTWCEDVVIP